MSEFYFFFYLAISLSSIVISYFFQSPLIFLRWLTECCLLCAGINSKLCISADEQLLCVCYLMYVNDSNKYSSLISWTSIFLSLHVKAGPRFIISNCVDLCRVSRQILCAVMQTAVSWMLLWDKSRPSLSSSGHLDGDADRSGLMTGCHCTFNVLCVE